MFFVLVLSPKDGARARNRSICEFDYEHEHHFIEHEHEFTLKDVGNSEALLPGRHGRREQESIRMYGLTSQMPLVSSTNAFSSGPA